VHKRRPQRHHAFRYYAATKPGHSSLSRVAASIVLAGGGGIEDGIWDDVLG